LTLEQLEASRSERMRLDGRGALTLEDARTWIEETGLCLFLPKRQFSSAIAPSFVEAVAGKRDTTPEDIALAEELLVRLETDGVAVRLNLLGLPGEAPDFVVASWVLPYVYALRGDRDWRRTPQLTGSRQVSQLAIEAYKLLETGDTTLTKLTHSLGREVTETAVLRAITELWQQLRIIPVVSAPGEHAQWQLLRTRFQKAIAEGASTSQVTAISVLASIYLQAVIAAGMEEVEIFLAPLTARSKVREVLRGLVATRQVHTLSMGHAPLFYVAGTLPEFAVAPTLYASSSMPASAYFMRGSEYEEELPEVAAVEETVPEPLVSALPQRPVEVRSPKSPTARKPASNTKSAAARPHFSRTAAHSRDRKPAQTSSASRPARRGASDSRPTDARATSGGRSDSPARWSPKAAAEANGKRNGAHAASAANGGSRSNGNGNGAKGSAKPETRASKPSSPAWGGRKVSGHASSTQAVSKPSATSRNGNGSTRPSSASRNGRKPLLAVSAKAGIGKRFGFAARPKQETKKRG
jgi:23S rRNA pseudouridine2605 synthase